MWAIVAFCAGVLLVAVALLGLGGGLDGAPATSARRLGRTPAHRVARVPLHGPELRDTRSRTDAAVAPTTTLSPSADVVPQAISIPAIGVRSPLIGLGLNADNTIQVPTDFAVAGWYVYRSIPGQPGPSVIAGHVDSRSGPGVFHRLKDLWLGATIEVQRSDGSVARFTVTGREQVDKDQFPTEQVYGPTSSAELRVITCGGAFNWSTRHYNDNLIVFASLEQIVRA